MANKLKLAGSLIGLGLGSLLAFKQYQRGPHHVFDTDMRGKVVVITGSSAGIGRETARGLAKLGATVVFACRDENKTLGVIQNLKWETQNNNLIYQHLNLSDLNSVISFNENFRKNFNKIDILINNAGVIHSKIDADGKDQMFKTNHLGHFLLTQQLIDLIVSQQQSRIINVASNAHFKVKDKVNWEQAYNGQDPSALHAYGVTKYANVLFTLGLAKRLQEKNVETKVVSLHPGVVDSEIFRWNSDSRIQQFLFATIYKVISISFLSEQEGAWTTLYTALAPFETLKSGAFYDKSQIAKYSETVDKYDQVEELWKFSEIATNRQFTL